MAKTLVTGGTGLVGRHLQEILPDAEYISSSDNDLRSEQEVRTLFAKGWNHVVHLAARVGGILDNTRHPAEFIEDNLLINANVLRQARLAEVPRFTALLSTCIYPDVCEHYPMTEEDIHKGPPQKTNFSYAIAKRTMATHIDAVNEQYGSKYQYLIPSNLYGEHDHHSPERSHFVTALLGKILKAQHERSDKLRLLGTGKPLRQFMYAADLANVIKECIDRDITESFNVANDENLSIRDIAEIALRVTGNEHLQLEFDENSPDGQFRKDVATVKMKRYLPDLRFTPLAEGLAKVYASYRQKMD